MLIVHRMNLASTVKKQNEIMCILEYAEFVFDFRKNLSLADNMRNKVVCIRRIRGMKTSAC
jgi:hypothetical protein